MEQPGRLVDGSDRDDLRVEDLPDPVADGVVDRLGIELTRNRVLHAVDQRQLRVALPRLVHQPRVLERDTQTAGQRLQQLPVRLPERVLAIDVLQRDHATRLPARHKRDEQNRLRRLAGNDLRDPHPHTFGGDVLVDQHRLACLEHMPGEAGRRHQLPLLPFAALDRIRNGDLTGRVVEHEDHHGLRVENLLDPVADGVVDRLRVELAGDRVLHAVDQRQLRVALPRLVHEPRVLERDAQAAGQRLHELLIRLGEGVLAVGILERDHPRRLAARDERDEEGRLRVLAGNGRAPIPLRLGLHALGDQQGRARFEHMLREAGRRPGLGLQPLAALDDVRELGQPRRLVERGDRDNLRVEDLLDPVADRVVDRLRIELTGNRVLHAVDQRQLGVPLSRLVHQPRVLECDAQAAGQRRQQADVVL